jgi:hypothetical protein
MSYTRITTFKPLASARKPTSLVSGQETIPPPRPASPVLTAVMTFSTCSE